MYMISSEGYFSVKNGYNIKWEGYKYQNAKQYSLIFFFERFKNLLAHTANCGTTNNKTLIK